MDTRDRRIRVGTVSPVARKSGIKNNTSQTTRHALPNFAMGNAGVNEGNGTSSDAQGDSNGIAAKVQVCQEDVRDKSLKSKIQAERVALENSDLHVDWGNIASSLEPHLMADNNRKNLRDDCFRCVPAS